MVGNQNLNIFKCLHIALVSVNGTVGGTRDNPVKVNVKENAGELILCYTITFPANIAFMSGSCQTMDGTASELWHTYWKHDKWFVLILQRHGLTMIPSMAPTLFLEKKQCFVNTSQSKITHIMMGIENFFSEYQENMVWMCGC